MTTLRINEVEEQILKEEFLPYIAPVFFLHKLGHLETKCVSKNYKTFCNSFDLIFNSCLPHKNPKISYEPYSISECTIEHLFEAIKEVNPDCSPNLKRVLRKFRGFQVYVGHKQLVNIKDFIGTILYLHKKYETYKIYKTK